ncbi:MAG: outer membrane protein assembly factor BamD [Gemmatimonadota bacterium]|nr:outer membrane protein assembly factor BamD [Gemmatimonadota bacterium]MDE3005523.1 outer membrane protein assembly factor BamD [Gemmatimonadota bacterium]
MKTEASRISCRRPLAILSLVLLVASAACGGGSTNRFAGLSAEELFGMATERFEAGDHGEAIQMLDRILVAYGDWAGVPDARLMLGDVYFARGDFLTARSEYTRFIDRYAAHPRSSEAALGVCKSLAGLAPNPNRDQGYTQEAIASCRNVVIDFAGNTASTEAARISNELRHTLAEKEYLNGEFYFRRSLWDAAIKYYEFVASLYPESDFAAPALLGVYRANLEIGYDDLAEEARDLLLQRYPDSEAAAEMNAEIASETDGDRG